MAISIVARDVGVEDEPPLLLVGFAESDAEDARSFLFQCDLRRNVYQDDSNWPEGESYCVSNERGLTRYGCVREVEFLESAIRVKFDEGAIRDLRLEDSEFEFQIAAEGVDYDEFSRRLREVLTCGRPEFHPRFLRG
jgi:hypothetical protein